MTDNNPTDNSGKIESLVEDSIVSACFRFGCAALPVMALAHIGIPSLWVASTAFCVVMTALMIARIIYVAVKRNPVKNQTITNIVTNILTLPYYTLLIGLIMLQNDMTDSAWGFILFAGAMTLFELTSKRGIQSLAAKKR